MRSPLALCLPLLLLIGSACLSQPAETGGVTREAFEPFAEERAGALFDFEERAAWTPEANLPLLVLDADPLPATVAPLSAATLQSILTTPGLIRRIDLRVVHDPRKWPEGATLPDNPPFLCRIEALEESPGSGALLSPMRVIAARPGDPPESHDAMHPTAALSDLLELLAAHPSLIARGRDQSRATGISGIREPWFELRIRVNTAPPSRLAIPRPAEFADPAVDTAIAALPPDEPPHFEFTPPPAPPADTTMAHTGEALAAEGIEMVDPHATLYTLAIDYPEDDLETFEPLHTALTALFALAWPAAN